MLSRGTKRQFGPTFFARMVSTIPEMLITIVGTICYSRSIPNSANGSLRAAGFFLSFFRATSHATMSAAMTMGIA